MVVAVAAVAAAVVVEVGPTVEHFLPWGSCESCGASAFEPYRPAVAGCYKTLEGPKPDLDGEYSPSVETKSFCHCTFHWGGMHDSADTSCWTALQSSVGTYSREQGTHLS